MDEYNAYVGLDIHKKTISVAIAEAGRNGECRSYGTIGNTPEQIRKLAAKLTQRHGAVHFVYEAGPTGYVPWRTLVEAGYACAVIGPAQIPKKPGDRVKTDRRDALQLARLDRAGELEAIWVPDEHHEAIRDLVRAREQAVQDLRRARQQVSSFLVARQLRRPGASIRTACRPGWEVDGYPGSLQAQGVIDAGGGIVVAGVNYASSGSLDVRSMAVRRR
jgi:transposase